MPNELKEEVLKCYPERMRYLAMNEELENCFECNSEDDFFEIFKMTPEQGFLDSYNSWFGTNDDNVWNKVCTTWDKQYIDLYFIGSTESTDTLKERIETKIQEIKKK